MDKQKHPLHPFEDKFFRVGDIVRVKGDFSDGTDHLDGLIGVVTMVHERECTVDFNIPNGEGRLIWKWNMTHA